MKKWIGIVLALVVLTVNPVFAEEETNWFFGAGYISSEIDTGVSGLTGTAALDDDDSGFKIFGGYQLNPYVGFEFAYADFGEASLKGNTGDTFVLDGVTYTFTRDNASLEVESWSISLGAVFSLPLEKVTGQEFLKWVTPYAKLGGFYWDAEASVTASGLNQTTASDDGFDFYFGGGVRINIHKNFVISGEWERYSADDDIDALSANVIIRF